MNDTFRLSICIATYNRVNFIAETLDSILLQINNQVEVLLVDGGSTDGTDKLMSEYRKSHSNFRYIRSLVNGGFDQDYSFAVSSAKGEYCWLFSDDDLMKPGAIDYILNELKLNYDLLVVNAEIKNSTLTKMLKSKCIGLSQNIVFSNKDFETFFVTAARHCSFVGSIVVRRSIWDSRDKSKYFGTMFVHVGVIFQKRYDGHILLIADPLVSIRYGNANWTVRSFEVSLFSWPKLIWGFNLVSDNAKSKVSLSEPWKSIPRLLFYRARGSFSKEEYDKYLVGRLCFIRGIVAYLIANIPGKLLNCTLYFYVSIFRIFHLNSKLVLIDLEKSKYCCSFVFFKRLFF